MHSHHEHVPPRATTSPTPRISNLPLPPDGEEGKKMMRSKSLLLPLRYFRIACPARVRVRASVSLPEWVPSLSVPNSSAAYPPEGTKEELGSEKHDPWARVRALPSRRMVGRRADGDKERSGIFGSFAPLPIPSRSSLSLVDEAKDGGPVKAMFLVSDRTGWTVEQAVDAARRQFEQCDRISPMNTHLFSGIDDMERLTEIIKEASKEEALLLHTLADPAMAEAAKNACRLWGVPSADMFRPIINCGLVNAPGTALGRSHGLGEGRDHGGVAAALRRYIVYVRNPDVVFANPQERDAWYRSFISVDESANVEGFWESRQLCSYYVSPGFAVLLTEEELASLKKKEGFLHACSDRRLYLQ